MSREVNVLPAIVKLSTSFYLFPTSCFLLLSSYLPPSNCTPAPDEIDDLDLVAFPDQPLAECCAFDDIQIVLYGHATRVDVKAREELGDGQRVGNPGDLVAVAIEGDRQRCITDSNAPPNDV